MEVGRATASVGSLLTILLPIGFLALLLRVVYALLWAPDLSGLGDDVYFHFTSLQVARGHGFSDAFASTPTGDPSPSAAHPPVYTLALAGVARLGLQSPDAQRIVGVLAGTVTVVLAGLIGGRLDGRRTAILAAGLCAASPAFVAADTALMSESLFGALVAGCVLLGLAIADRPSVRLAAALGLMIGLAGLTRGEGLLLLALIGVPVAAAAGLRRGPPLLLVMISLAALTVSPWAIRNERVFGRFVLSTNDGTTLAGANCDATYFGEELGGFTADCLSPRSAGENPAVTADRRRNEAIDYFLAHQRRALEVAGYRLLRLGVFYDFETATKLEGREQGLQTAGIIAFYPAMVLGLAGAFLLARARRGRELAIVLAPLGLAIVTAAMTYGLVRLRHPAEAMTLVLAALAISRVAGLGRGSATMARA